ncbi:MAG: hypothetical protein WKG00_27965 [Polyangiaceae bacterium]
MQCPVRSALPASALLLVAVCAAALVGCDSPQGGGQIGGEKTAGCYEVVSTPLALDEVSTLGFSAADALPTLEGPRTETLLWAKGGDTVLSLEALYVGGETRLVESEYRSYGQTTPELDCPPAIEIDLDLDFATADGQFAETWQATARADSAQSASFFHDIDLGALTGTYQVTEVDPADYDSVSVFASVVFSGQAASGSLSGQATFSESDRTGDDDGTVGAELFEVASF